MGVSSTNGDFEPLESLDTLHDTNLPLFHLENGSLLDMQLKVCTKRELLVRSLLLTKIADSLQFLLHCLLVAVF